ncbi:hypothetical protein [Nocardiopsis ansamitocini]|uniref:ATP/GTP-binding protein n=1 Tax=Nocardiopsis ansamitocini TaxID=1670832 RepID=A0A9W6P5P2_9ACTN|nr:hypothetical protein [Nocardiopsis ansamitocini]GLU47468.1 hypothetical protein Nans01_18190 [Nocardiopsis ansamitocini]
MLRRTGAVAMTAALLLAATTPANADTPDFLSSIQCGSSGGAGCSVLLQWAIEYGGVPGSSGGGGTSTGSGDGGGTGGADDPYAGIDWDAIDWSAIDWDAVDWESIDWDAVDYGDGAGAAPQDPMVAIQEALGSFELPAPEIVTSPAVGSRLLVHTPIWFWLQPEGWEPASTSAEVPGLSVGVSATPTQTRWTLGDGTQIICDGPGTPFDPATHDPAAESPDCGHVYTTSSFAEPGGVFQVTAEVTWGIGWEISDDEGTETGEMDPVVTAAQIELPVEESQGLVTSTGRG